MKMLFSVVGRRLAGLVVDSGRKEVASSSSGGKSVMVRESVSQSAVVIVTSRSTAVLPVVVIADLPCPVSCCDSNQYSCSSRPTTSSQLQLSQVIGGGTVTRRMEEGEGAPALKPGDEPGEVVDARITTKRRRPLQNTFAAKKTVAQGMMDVALITANANQLRFVLEYSSQSRTYYVVISLIIVSLLLQVAVGISLIFKGRYDLTGDLKLEQANRINNYVVVGVFLITVINVFIAAFSTTAPVQDS